MKGLLNHCLDGILERKGVIFIYIIFIKELGHRFLIRGSRRGPRGNRGHNNKYYPLKNWLTIVLGFVRGLFGE